MLCCNRHSKVGATNRRSLSSKDHFNCSTSGHWQCVSSVSLIIKYQKSFSLLFQFSKYELVSEPASQRYKGGADGEVESGWSQRAATIKKKNGWGDGARHHPHGQHVIVYDMGLAGGYVRDSVNWTTTRRRHSTQLESCKNMMVVLSRCLDKKNGSKNRWRQQAILFI